MKDLIETQAETDLQLELDNLSKILNDLSKPQVKDEEVLKITNTKKDGHD